jgi:hypothetical protein
VLHYAKAKRRPQRFEKKKKKKKKEKTFLFIFIGRGAARDDRIKRTQKRRNSGSERPNKNGFVAASTRIAPLRPTRPLSNRPPVTFNHISRELRSRTCAHAATKAAHDYRPESHGNSESSREESSGEPRRGGGTG